ncbi:MAG: hypothetical protein ACPHXR_03225 [Flavicella sp.]
MRAFYFFGLFLFLSCSKEKESSSLPISVTGPLELTLVAPLEDTLSESSGLLAFGEELLSHNDSGNANTLYSVNPNTAKITNTFAIDNIVNTDWEDLAQDANHIYVADIGNNNGTRKDLKIYKIAKEQVMADATQDKEIATISFSYELQDSFIPAPFQTNFDAEALVAMQGDLYVFTKNWGNQKTDVHKIPSNSGTYEAKHLGTIEVAGFITGADYDAENNSLVLIGYNLQSPFLIIMDAVNLQDLANSNFERYELQVPATYSRQLEAVCFFESYLYFTSEQSSDGASGLFRLNRGGF